jgi:DNA-binding MarR family transcriptional regulator
MQYAAPTLAGDLDARLVALWRQIGRVQRHDLSRTAASVLATLRDGGPQRITALAVAEAIAQPSMTTLIGQLERDGLVARRPDPADARAVLVTITADGLERLLAIREARAAAVEARLAALEPEDREALAAAIPALDKLIEGAPRP